MDLNFSGKEETTRLVELDLTEQERSELLSYGREAILKDDRAILEYAVIDILRKTIDTKNLKLLERFNLINSFEKNV